jgi:hypothetical protein
LIDELAELDKRVGGVRGKISSIGIEFSRFEEI